MDEHIYRDALGWITGWLCDRNPGEEVSGATRPYQEGLLDSFATVELVTELEDRFSVFFDQADFLSDDFQSVAGLSRLVATRAFPLAC